MLNARDSGGGGTFVQPLHELLDLFVIALSLAGDLQAMLVSNSEQECTGTYRSISGVLDVASNTELVGFFYSIGSETDTYTRTVSCNEHM